MSTKSPPQKREKEIETDREKLSIPGASAQSKAGYNRPSSSEEL